MFTFLFEKISGYIVMGKQVFGKYTELVKRKKESGTNDFVHTLFDSRYLI